MDPSGMALWALAAGVLLYFAHLGRRKVAERRDWAEWEKRDANRQQQDLATAKVEKYLELAADPLVEGISALAMLGLHELDSDQRVRDAIYMMRLRSKGEDPLGRGARQLLEGVDLQRFFLHVAEEDIDFSSTSVADALASMEDSCN